MYKGFSAKVAFTAVAGLLMLAGCAKQTPEPTPTPTPKPTIEKVSYGIPVVGACYGDDRLKDKAKTYEETFSRSIAKEMRNNPTFNDKVDCTESHMFEVLSVLDIPQEITGEYADLVNPSTIQHANVRRWANTQCAEALTPNAQGLNAGLPWSGATISPMLPNNWSVEWFLTEPEAFKVKPQVTCILSNDTMKPISSNQILTSYIPASDRLCFSTDAPTMGDCNLPHEFERFGVINWDKSNGNVIQPPLEQGEITPKFEPYVQEALLKTCTNLTVSLGSKTKAKFRLNVEASQWPNSIGVYSVYCETAALDKVNREPVKHVGSIFDSIPAPVVPKPTPSESTPTPQSTPTADPNIVTLN